MIITRSLETGFNNYNEGLKKSFQRFHEGFEKGFQHHNEGLKGVHHLQAVEEARKELEAQCNLRMLVYLVMYDSGRVSLEYLLALTAPLPERSRECVVPRRVSLESPTVWQLEPSRLSLRTPRHGGFYHGPLQAQVLTMG